MQCRRAPNADQVLIISNDIYYVNWQWRPFARMNTPGKYPCKDNRRVGLSLHSIIDPAAGLHEAARCFSRGILSSRAAANLSDGCTRIYQLCLYCFLLRSLFFALNLPNLHPRRPFVVTTKLSFHSISLSVVSNDAKLNLRTKYSKIRHNSA